MAETVADIFTEVIIAPAYEPRRAWRCLARKKNIRVLRGRPSRRPAAPSSGRSAAACCVQQRDALDAPGDDPPNWTLATGDARRPDDAGRPGVRLAGRAAR